MELFDSVYKLYNQYKDRDFVYWIPLVLFTLAVKVRYFWLLMKSGRGIPESEDSDWYIAYAHSLMTHFRIGLNMDEIMYAGYNLLLTALLALFKDPVAVVFIQVLTASFSVILVYKIAKLLFNRTTAVIASLIYGYSWDITLWSTYLLTDSFFISLLLLCVYFLLQTFETGKKTYKWLFIATSLYMLVFRPAGVMTLMFVMAYAFIRMDKTKLVAFLRKYRLLIGGVLVAGLAVFVFALASGRLEPLLESMQLNAKKVLYNMYAEGWIYDKPSGYDYHFTPDYTIDIANSLILSFFIHNWDHILILYGRRSIAFLGRWVWDPEARSGMLTYVRHLVPIALFAVGTVAAAVNGLFRRASVIWLVIAAVFLFCVLFFIDGLYRYKAPGIPFIAIAVAYGADRTVRGIFVVAKKYTGMLLWDKGKY
ncbi:glycosyltransferase family 39 protein [Paenibacillus ginsengarvi]|uniref:Glycosyltransferase RgtA/B/C/D-like domain-containing protein n=1 Tax=Paenibacillus ginsengarvi TaxID=400777 RepID=A0A3B0C231_9BACL|nr:glycosyltransferase family 39 protein [Paenibacillus ginsengarvi]RKN78259.1 hypothetical protein D7M11_23415 [Paenibacillus ginsengarvi]